MSKYDKALPINELYTCIQGEGKYAGIPHILIRFVGCRLRCQFANSFCDTSHNSWKPEKGSIKYEDIIAFYETHPVIKYTMITGGGPTLSAEVLQEICSLAKSYGHTVTIETEGSEFVQTCADLISLSPKLSSSTPRLGNINPYTNQEVKQSHIDQHEKWRQNYEAMALMINRHEDYIIKPVVTNERDLIEVEELLDKLNVPNNRVYLMPAGVTDEQLNATRKWLFDVCIKNGYRYSDRLHVIVYGDKRGV